MEIAEAAEEIRFYLEDFMSDQARAAFEKLETLTSDAAVLAPLRAAIASASAAKAPEEPELEIAEINADDPETFEIELEAPTTEDADQPQATPTALSLPHSETSTPEPTHAEAVGAKPDELTSLVTDLESAIGDSFPLAPSVDAAATAVKAACVQLAPAPHAAAQSSTPLPGWPGAASAQDTVEPSAEQKPEPVAASAPAPAAKTTSASTATTAGAAAPAPTTMSYAPTPLRPLGANAQAGQPSGSIDLSEMFGELKHELEEGASSTDEDPETHYNMGVAFREMGLLDEAIAELQKVCASIDRGHPFAQVVQTYTWLAQCFLDKGVPEAAIRWYEKALGIPGLDGEARVAINYELGAACESAQDKPGALRHFTYVYGANIDYRDVAERIQALKS